MRIGLRELVFILLLAAIPVGAWWFVFRPANIQIREARAEAMSKQRKLTQLESAMRQIDDLGNEIDRLTQAINVYEAKLPAEKEVEVILREVWQLAVKNGLKPKSVRADKPIKSPRYSELPLKMAIDGDFTGYYTFLLELERLSRITRIPQMELSKLENAEGQMEARFTLTIFFEPDERANTVALTH